MPVPQKWRTMNLIDSWWAIIRDGLDHVHPIQFVIIALLLGFTARTLGAAVFAGLFASVLYIAVDILMPAMINNQPPFMPVLDKPFEHLFLSLFCAFLVVTLLFSVLRSVVESILR